MAFKIQFLFLLFLITIFSFFLPSSPLSNNNQHHHRHQQKRTPKITLPSRSQSFPQTPFPPNLDFSSATIGYDFPKTSSFEPRVSGGQWTLLQESVGVSAMHMQLLYNNKVVIFDRTDFGPSNLSLPAGKCRYNDEALPVDCTAHSLIYDLATNTYRPLMVQTDVWCSSGAVNADGTLVQTGGYHAGDHKIRLFTPCNDDNCDWIELPQNLTVQRWYASTQILPDGRVIIVGGRRAFSYEFFPKTSTTINGGDVFQLPFLQQTTDPKEENNLYPFLHLLPDGNLYIFANQRSIILDYVKNTVVKEFPVIPGEKRTYPATGSSLILPLRLNSSGGPVVVEVMICGGANGGSYIKAQQGVYVAASKTCGRMKLTDENPQWVMEEMPTGRVMPDMLLLPTGDVIILNGAANGTAGWEGAVDPVFNPLFYKPDEPDPSKRFTILTPSKTPRMYHSAALLLPDGRILVGGSNPHVKYNFTGVKYPTDLSLEIFMPPYLDPQHAQLRPSILSVEGNANNAISYGQQFSITLTLGLSPLDRGFTVTMIAPSFTTHSFAMNQRQLVLEIVNVQQLSAFAHKVTVFAPPSTNIAPPGYYMLFVVHQGIPGQCLWVKIQ